MRLTTKGRYAVTAMLDLAMHYKGEPVVLADISRRQSISLAYLEQLFARLRKHGLVNSTRGPGGGYAPGRPLSEISVVAVIDAVHESMDATRCAGASNCHGNRRCLTHELWADLSAHISAFLNEISFAELVEREDRRRAARGAEKVVTLSNPGQRVDRNRGLP